MKIMANEASLVDEGSKEHPFMSEYKKRTWKIDQETRRHVLLEEQKRRREDSYNAFRDFSDIFTFNDDSNSGEHFCGEMDERSEDPRFSKIKDLFMFSEWMTELPDDFEDKWVLVPCPVGRRCLVRSCKGFTSVYGKTGYQTARFKSGLPNGGYQDHSVSKHSKSDITVLDCIWNGTVQKYFILDILYWKSQSYLDTDVSFRNFWINSKIEEIPWITEKSTNNPYPFVPLNSYPCDLINISSVISRYPYFECDKPPIDGILFYHKDGYYTPGVTPLVLWAKPFMLIEILGQDISLAEQYLQRMPKNYKNMYDFIAKYEDVRKQKMKRRKTKKEKSANEFQGMELCTSEGEEENETCSSMNF